MAEESLTAAHRPAKSGYWKAISAIAWKDLAAELRSRELLSAMLVFSLLVILIFNLTVLWPWRKTAAAWTASCLRL